MSRGEWGREREILLNFVPSPPGPLRLQTIYIQRLGFFFFFTRVSGTLLTERTTDSARTSMPVRRLGHNNVVCSLGDGHSDDGDV